MTVSVDTRELEQKVQRMYRAVATEPAGRYHFELGRRPAERLGYLPDAPDRIPTGAIDSFAGVGYFFDLAELCAGEAVVDRQRLGDGRVLRGHAAHRPERTSAAVSAPSGHQPAIA
jgi:hypothetical protein